MIILFGPAGSGKSTQGRTLADRYGWKWLSVGQVLRETGKFNEILKRGELVDDAEVVSLMNREISRADAEGMDVILDGYPRDKKQTEIMLADDNSEFFDGIDAAILLEVPEDELWARIEERGRTDDTKEVVRRRFEIYEQNIYSILPLLEQENIPILRVDGVGDYDVVTERLDKAIKEVLPDTADVFNHTDVHVIENDAVEKEKSYGE